MKTLSDELGCSFSRVRNTLISRGVRINSRGAQKGNQKRFKTGRYVDRHGYVWIRLRLIPDAEGLIKTYNGYASEHRAVMAIHLGRELKPSESVHHKDGDRSNNAIENLQLRMSASHGAGAVLCCADCGSKNIIGEEI